MSLNIKQRILINFIGTLTDKSGSTLGISFVLNEVMIRAFEERGCLPDNLESSTLSFYRKVRSCFRDVRVNVDSGLDRVSIREYHDFMMLLRHHNIVIIKENDDCYDDELISIDAILIDEYESETKNGDSGTESGLKI